MNQVNFESVFIFSGMIVGNDTFYIRPLNDQGSNRISDEHVWVNSKDEPHYFKCGTGMSVLIYSCYTS